MEMTKEELCNTDIKSRKLMLRIRFSGHEEVVDCKKVSCMNFIDHLKYKTNTYPKSDTSCSDFGSLISSLTSNRRGASPHVAAVRLFRVQTFQVVTDKIAPLR